MNDCPITGTATISTTPNGWEWVTYNDAIHISADLVEGLDSGPMDFLTERYCIGERCEFAPTTYHARLRPEASA